MAQSQKRLDTPGLGYTFIGFYKKIIKIEKKFNSFLFCQRDSRQFRNNTLVIVETRIVASGLY